MGTASWYPGSQWLPYGLEVPKTMAEAEDFAKKYRTVSLVPQVELGGLEEGVLSEDFYQPAVGEKPKSPLSKKKKRKKAAKK